MRRTLIALALAASVVPLVAQTLPTEAPGAPDVGRVRPGTYAVDPAHTQVAWTVDHLGFSPYYGIFGDVTGTLTLDPAKLESASVNVVIPIGKVVTTSADLNKHLMTPDFFDAAKQPIGTFASTAVEVKGTKATIRGNLTLRGVTKPVVLDARFHGAGVGMMNKLDTVGFEATTRIKRSDFGISFGVPLVSDEVDLKITAAFERKS